MIADTMHLVESFLWLEPVLERRSEVEWMIWHSSCGLYSVVRRYYEEGVKPFDGFDPGQGRFGAGVDGFLIDNYYPTLLAALRACEFHWCREAGLRRVISNAEEVVLAAGESAYHCRRDDGDYTKIRTASGKLVVDRFGTRLGTQAARINATLSYRPREIEFIAQETQLRMARVWGHLKWLAERDKVVILEGRVWVPRT